MYIYSESVKSQTDNWNTIIFQREMPTVLEGNLSRGRFQDTKFGIGDESMRLDGEGMLFI